VFDVGDFLGPGDGVWWGQGSAEPEPLVNQLLDAVDRVGPIRAFSGLTWNERLSGDVVPCHYSAIPRMFATGQLPNDVGLVQVSRPDGAGMVTLGTGVEYVADALPHTRILIAEINEQMPRTVGGPRLPLTAFAAVVETDRPLREPPTKPVDEVERAIARHVAGIIEDGATIQIGVGSLPSAVLEALAGHADLGLHSGMIADGVLSLIGKGVLTGARKEIDPGLAVTGAALCSAEGYRRLGDFPLEFRAASYTHSPAVLSRLTSLVSINSAIEVDLLGQVGAELARGVHIGAVGGQVDFSRAASLTGARSIIALRSTVGTGESEQSTIVPALHSGVVTTARVDVDAVVTEHGVAMLTGCTVAERALRLIEVAAPAHREHLERSLVDQEGR
jgi:acyl-CoA hydrolase